MVSVELTILGDIPLGTWVVVLLGPSDYVAHCLHDCHVLDRLYIEVVLRNLSSDPWVNWHSLDCMGGLSSGQRLFWLDP